MTSAGRSSSISADAAIDQRFLRLPSREMLRAFFRDGALCSLLWLAVYGGANWLTKSHGYRVRLWTDFDLAIPFVPAAAALYLSIFPMFWVAPFALRTSGQLRALAKSLAWSIAIAGIGFVLLPGGHVHTIEPPSGPFGKLFWVADQLNMSYNYLPSLHVGMSVCCAYAYSAAASRIGAKYFYWLWTAAIAASTLLTHQHYVADVLTGGALGWIVSARVLHSKVREGGTP
jgi:membrane-associated phospholipid phosphatase